MSSVDWDEGVYIVMAQQWRAGGLPYAAVWDQHPPGVPAMLALVQGVIPDPVTGARVLAALAVAMTAITIQRFCARYAGRPRSGLIAAILYIVCISRFGGLAANTEIFNNLIVSAASYLLFGVTRAEGSSRLSERARMVGAAVLFGIGLQIKYVIFPEAVILCLGCLLVSAGRCRRATPEIATALLMIVAGCLPTLLTAGYFWRAGLLNSYIDANLRSNLAYLTIPPLPFDVALYSVSGMFPIAGPSLLIAWTIRRWARSLFRWRKAMSLEAWLLLWIGSAVLNVCLPFKFYPHYFAALYAPACVAGALSIGYMKPVSRRGYAALNAVLFVTAIPLWIAGVVRAERHAAIDTPRQIARSLQEDGATGNDIFVYDYEPVIYALAGAKPPSKYVIRPELADFSSSAHVDGMTEISRVMDAAPRFVVALADPRDDQRPDALDRTMAERLLAYHAVRRFHAPDGETVLLYRR